MGGTDRDPDVHIRVPLCYSHILCDPAVCLLVPDYCSATHDHAALHRDPATSLAAGFHGCPILHIILHAGTIHSERATHWWRSASGCLYFADQHQLCFPFVLHVHHLALHLSNIQGLGGFCDPNPGNSEIYSSHQYGSTAPTAHCGRCCCVRCPCRCFRHWGSDTQHASRLFATQTGYGKPGLLDKALSRLEAASVAPKVEAMRCHDLLAMLLLGLSQP